MCRDKALLRVRQNGNDLFAGDAGKPFQELLNGSALFQILKERPDRHAGVLEYPRPAHDIVMPLHHIALTPIKHAANLSPPTPTVQCGENGHMRCLSW